MQRPLISVILCTYNRAALLTAVLQTLCDQTLAAAAHEVIIVDNNSTDETARVSHAAAARHPHVRYCVEPRQGLAHARNRGWQEAKGTYVAYIDDDCKVPAGWLAIAQAVIEEIAPDVFGGPYFAFYNCPKPAWFKDEYGSWSPCENASATVAPDAFHGGNLFLRRELLPLTGGFDPTLGMKGRQLAYGEETELLRRLHTIRPATSFYYEPRLFVYHLVRPEKLSLWWQLRSTFMHGRAYYPIYQPGETPFSRRECVRYPMKTLRVGISALLQSWFRRDRNRYPYWQNSLYESPELQHHLHNLGIWSAYVQRRWPLMRSRSGRHDA